jgi:hypothetical protein
MKFSSPERVTRKSIALTGAIAALAFGMILSEKQQSEDRRIAFGGVICQGEDLVQLEQGMSVDKIVEYQQKKLGLELNNEQKIDYKSIIISSLLDGQSSEQTVLKQANNESGLQIKQTGHFKLPTSCQVYDYPF